MTGPVTVSSLHIYPVKSMRGIGVQEARVAERGFEYDRRFMVVDAHRTFITQRQHPRLALVDTSIEGSNLMISVSEAGAVRVPLELPAADRIMVQVWHDVVPACTVSAQADEFLSTFLGIACTLVFMPDDAQRPVKQPYAREHEHTSFADAFPFLLTSESSLEDLNHRLEKPLPMNRFRPNIVVEGTAPYAEDGWNRIRIGSAEFRVVKPCSRCATTTVDQSTGVRGEEPLRTLAQYRGRDGTVNFGQNLIHTKAGVISVGHPVEILE
jgi:uncharacterized protein YcbX